MTILTLPTAASAAFSTPTIPHRQHLTAVPPKKPPRLVLLDRDGVVNEDVGSPGVVQKSQLRLTPGAAGAVGRLRRSGCCVALVTNQSCVGKGLLTKSGLDDIHELVRSTLLEDDEDAVLDGLYTCTSTREDNDPRMKPMAGMVHEAYRDFGVGRDESVFIGDTLTDMQASMAGGVGLRILVETGYGLRLMGGQAASTPPQLVARNSIDPSSALSSVVPFIYAKNLEGAVSWLLRDNATADSDQYI